MPKCRVRKEIIRGGICMHDLKSQIYMVVAMPMQFLWAPFEMAIVNIAVSLAVMMACIGFFGITPLAAMAPLVVGHAVLIYAGTRNPHLAATLRAAGKFHSRRLNISRVQCGAKFVP